MSPHFEQRYISDELTHCIGRNEETDDDRYEILKIILESNQLKAKTRPGTTVDYDAMYDFQNKFSSKEKFIARVVCFCDIPISDLKFHMKKYSKFGISFKKSYLVERGVNPIFYVAMDSRFKGKRNEEIYNDMISEYDKLALVAIIATTHGKNPNDIEFQLRKLDTDLAEHVRNKFDGGLSDEEYDFYKMLSPFLINTHRHIFCFMKPWNAYKGDEHDKNYYMEREWRLFGDLNFQFDNISRICLPPSYARRFREDFPNYYGQISHIDW